MKWVPLALLLAGCGQSVCDKRLSAAQSCGLGFSEALLEECNEALDTCSPLERSQLERSYDCLIAQGYEDCSNGTTTSGTSADQIDAIAGCEKELEKISDSCLAALGGTLRTTFSDGR